VNFLPQRHEDAKNKAAEEQGQRRGIGVSGKQEVGIRASGDQGTRRSGDREIGRWSLTALDGAKDLFRRWLTLIQLTDSYAYFSQAAKQLFAMGFSCLPVAMLIIAYRFGCPSI